MATVTTPRVHRLFHREEVMGTFVTFDGYFLSAVPHDAHGALEDAVGELHRIDRIFSTWKLESPVSRLRRGELGLGEAPDEVREVLDSCLTARRASGGWFDPWRLPGGVDPTGYVKGWAAQRALDRFQRPGMIGAVVNAAGDIATVGIPAPGQRFRLGVVDPADRRRLATVVEPPGAVATSGTYERGAHLVNPHTGSPQALVASATVTGPDLGLCDALATGLCVGGEDALPALDRLAGYEALLIPFHGAWKWSRGFPFAPDTAPVRAR